jgi:hypothetical protein
MKAAEIARVYNVSLRTAKRYRKLGAPVDDRPAMLAWIEEHRSRTGVGKYTPRDSEPVTIAPVREVAAEIVPVEPRSESIDSDTDDDKSSTLQRLEAAERTAYQRYIDSGGSERAA